MGIKPHRGRLDESGQMAVEMAVMFPVVLTIALIAVNALTFFSECAAFDSAFREGARLYCTSPGYGQYGSAACSNLEQYVAEVCHEPNESVSVSVQSTWWGYQEYIGTLVFRPTLFAHELNTSVFGVAFPVLTHKDAFTVDSYRPGVLL